VKTSGPNRANQATTVSTKRIGDCSRDFAFHEAQSVSGGFTCDDPVLQADICEASGHRYDLQPPDITKSYTRSTPDRPKVKGTNIPSEAKAITHQRTKSNHQQYRRWQPGKRSL